MARTIRRRFMARTSRRRFLVSGALGAVGAVAGCAGYRGDGTSPTATDEGTNGTSPSGATPAHVDLPVARNDLVRGAPKDAIPAITEPTFGEDWSGIEVESRSEFGEKYTAEPRLTTDDRIIGVERGGVARAYPLRLLNWHEVVNDFFDPQPDGREAESDGPRWGPLLVTYCPLCGSGVTAVRTVNDQETTFGVSGFLFRNDLVMYDQLTDSLWSQIMATAINGPETGQTLTQVPSTRRIGLGGDFDDDRLHPKALVLGVESDGVARAFPMKRVKEAGVVNDSVGGLPVVVAVGPGDALVAYERTVGGEPLTFERDDGRHLAGGGSRWRIVTGEAVDGPHRGTHLTPANDASPMFFFAWLDFNPETEVYGEPG